MLRVYTGLHSPLTIRGLDDVTAGDDTEYAVTKYSYDLLGRLIQITDALGCSENSVYDKSTGLVLSFTDRNAQNFVYTYDALNNMTSKSLSDGTNSETKIYNTAGQTVSAQNDTTTINYTYNDKGFLVSETDTSAGTEKAYDYDSAGNRTSFILKRNGQIEMSQNYTYDKLNRLISVSENGNIIATYSYDNSNNRIQTVSGGETTNYTYNIANLLTSQTTGDKLNEQYTYCLNGNQKTKTSNGTLTIYEYDGMNRLAKENDTEYSFDDFGNRKSMTSVGSTTDYTYDLNNRLIKSVEKTGDETKTTAVFYDFNGNTIAKSITTNVPFGADVTGDYTVSQNSNENVALYEYNCYNQLAVVDTNGVVSNYTYAPDGMRTSKTVDGKTTNFVYDNANVIAEITSDRINKYFRGFEIIKNDNSVYYLYNGQGDVSILSDSAGNTVASYIFDAYGNQTGEGTVYNPFGYRGEYTDSESGFVYLRARMYDPQTGRFINEDPIRDGLNWYVYCDNDPISKIDFFGLFDYNSLLFKNSCGGDVKTLQNELAILGFYTDKIDGIFGENTQAAVKAYQRKVGLQVDGIVGINTWDSLGLIYRNEKDIEAGVKIVNVGVTQYFDISIPVTNAVSNSKQNFENHKMDITWFIEQVKNNGKWNLKKNEKVWSSTLAISTNSYGQPLIFYGRPVVIDDIGNITYGYLGRAAGFPEIVLKGGSLGYHIKNHGISGMDNEFADEAYVQLGIDWYDGKNIQVRFGSQ